MIFFSEYIRKDKNNLLWEAGDGIQRPCLKIITTLPIEEGLYSKINADIKYLHKGRHFFIFLNSPKEENKDQYKLI